MGNKNSIHIRELDRIRYWLSSNGWKIEKPRAIYEVLRARKDGRLHMFSLYQRSENKNMLTCAERDMCVLKEFKDFCNTELK